MQPAYCVEVGECFRYFDGDCKSFVERDFLLSLVSLLECYERAACLRLAQSSLKNEADLSLQGPIDVSYVRSNVEYRVRNFSEEPGKFLDSLNNAFFSPNAIQITTGFDQYDPGTVFSEGELSWILDLSYMFIGNLVMLE